MMRLTPLLDTLIDGIELYNDSDFFTGKQLSTFDSHANKLGLLLSVIGLDIVDDIQDAKRTIKGTSETVYRIGDNLHDGMKIGTDDALDAAEDFLGKGYKDMGGGRYVSADGTKQVRMTDSDLAEIGNHAGAPHLNFEYMIPNPKKPGKMIPDSNNNYHIFIGE